MAAYQGDYARAVVLLEESLALKRDLGDTWGVAVALNNLGDVAREQGHYGRAVVLLEESLALRRDLGDTWGVAYALTNLGEVARHQGEYRRAMALYTESLKLFRIVGDKNVAAHCLEGLAGVACVHEQMERVTYLCGAAAALREATGMPLTPTEYVTYDRVMTTARAALGEDAFAAVWAAAELRPLEEVIAEALAFPDDLPV